MKFDGIALIPFNDIDVQSSLDVSDISDRMELMRRQEDEQLKQPLDCLAFSPLDESNLYSSTMDQEDVSERMVVMLRQEDNYKTFDYMEEIDDILSFATSPANDVCRATMCDWCYKMVGFCDFQRETVAHAFSYLDRYLCTKKGRNALCDRDLYALTCVTALYMAIKVHECGIITTPQLEFLSQGSYSAQAIEIVEKAMLKALEWRLNGPTPLAFIRYFLSLLPKSVDPRVRSELLDAANYQAELSYFKCSFVPLKNSEIALSAVLNAVNEIEDESFLMERKIEFLEVIERCSGLDVDDTLEIQADLRLLIDGPCPGVKKMLANTEALRTKTTEPHSFTDSPRSVSSSVPSS